jgi:hypothetical protein
MSLAVAGAVAIVVMPVWLPLVLACFHQGLVERQRKAAVATCIDRGDFPAAHQAVRAYATELLSAFRDDSVESLQDLQEFLQGTPIFPQWNSPLLQAIELSRHARLLLFKQESWERMRAIELLFRARKVVAQLECFEAPEMQQG